MPLGERFEHPDRFAPALLAAFPPSAILGSHLGLPLRKQRPSGLTLDWMFLLPAPKSFRKVEKYIYAH
jgi:hypothetical protein